MVIPPGKDVDAVLSTAFCSLSLSTVSSCSFLRASCYDVVIFTIGSTKSFSVPPRLVSGPCHHCYGIKLTRTSRTHGILGFCILKVRFC